MNRFILTLLVSVFGFGFNANASDQRYTSVSVQGNMSLDNRHAFRELQGYVKEKIRQLPVSDGVGLDYTQVSSDPHCTIRIYQKQDHETMSYADAQRASNALRFTYVPGEQKKTNDNPFGRSDNGMDFQHKGLVLIVKFIDGTKEYFRQGNLEQLLMCNKEILTSLLAVEFKSKSLGNIPTICDAQFKGYNEQQNISQNNQMFFKKLDYQEEVFHVSVLKIIGITGGDLHAYRSGEGDMGMLTPYGVNFTGSLVSLYVDLINVFPNPNDGACYTFDRIVLNPMKTRTAIRAVKPDRKINLDKQNSGYLRTFMLSEKF